jgi:hypothetical protein
MDSPPSSASASSHYANLLSTVSELKSDLQNTLTKMHSLEEQNIYLQKNYHLIKEELLETRKKYNEARENYLTAAALRLESQKQNEIFIEKIKYQLTEKTKEFEQHRDRYTPQDIEYIRIQVQEELEVSHRQKIQIFENEIQKQKDIFYSSRRELERFKTESETRSQSQQSELVHQRDEYESIIFSLRKQVAELQLREYTPDKDDKLRTQRIKIHELETIQQSLEEEIILLRKERDESSHAAEIAKGRWDDQTADLKSRVTILESDLLGKDHRIGVLMTSISSLESQLQLKRQSLEDTERRVSQLQNSLLEIENRFR